MTDVYHAGIAGVIVPAEPDRVVNVHFDGRRIWSFRTGTSDGTRDGDTLSVGWPAGLRPFLRGVTEVTITEHESGPLARTELRFPGSDARLALADAEGRPMVIGPHGRPMVGFDADGDSTAALLTAATAVLEVMRAEGIEGFLAYGTLLGAVREGGFIGHDNDVDLGYVSECPRPVDVVAESMRLQRALVRNGMRVERYSGAGLKVWVQDGAGVHRGLDVFGGFWDGDRLALMGELHLPFERDWIHPLGTATLEDVDFPVPHRPERLLEAMYGPHWRVPDPTFEFDSGTEARHQLGRWFRGIRQHRNEWDRFYAPAARRRPMVRHHALAEVIAEAEPGATIIDVGCGRGRDAAWLGSLGHRTYGLEFSEPAVRFLTERVREHGWPTTYHIVNLLELRHALSWGARIARIEGPRAMIGRHLVNCVDARGREGLWRMASMGLRGGGRLHLEFLAAEEPRPAEPGDLVQEVPASLIEEEARGHGAVVESATFFEPIPFEMPPLTPAWDGPSQACRMVLSWK